VLYQGRASATLITFAHSPQKRLRMTVVHLNWLAPYQEAAQDKRPYRGRSGKVISFKTKPREGKVRPITDVKSTALRKRGKGCTLVGYLG
jgi:hypothetical protein